MKINVIEIIKIGAEINRVRQSILCEVLFYHNNTLHRLQKWQKQKQIEKAIDYFVFFVFVFKVQIDVNAFQLSDSNCVLCAINSKTKSI